MDDLMDKIVSLCKRRGFIFQSSEIYGGLANTWDYGPYGAELKKNVKDAWWRSSVRDRSDIYGMDAAILMHPKTWDASGHVKSFADLLVDCKSCKKRFRVDQIGTSTSLSANGERSRTIGKKCPECEGTSFTEARAFSLMFETNIGPVKTAQSVTYLRPETAQGMFVNFSNILAAIHPRLPFGLAQIGKAFRNEVTTGNFTFRTLEFEQMEIEYFVKPDEADRYYEYWVNERFSWYIGLGIRKDNLRNRPHSKDELAHYALACTDIEYQFPFGWSELEGIANRTDFDLRQHSKFSGKELQYFDNETKKKFYPYIIEPSGGIDRAVLAFLVDAYREDKVKGETRVFLSLSNSLVPVKVAVLPLLKNRPQIVELAKKIAKELKKDFVCVYDDTASIGKLYRRQDEVGTLYCVTVDVQSLDDKQVTVRDRDTMKQDRVGVDRLREYLTDKIKES